MQGMVPTIESTGADGMLSGETFTVVAGPAPHPLLPETRMVPVPEPTVVMILPVVLDPLQPVPDTVQTNEVAPVQVAL